MSSQPDPAPADTRFQELFEQAPVSIQILAPDGRTLRVNRAWKELWQIHDGTPLKAHVLGGYNVLHDPQLHASGIVAFLRRALAGESVQIPAMRYDVAALDGGGGPARWVTGRAHPIRDGAGQIIEVMLMHEDITERVAAENALRMREERFRSLVMATSQTVWTTGPDGKVLEDSASWRAVTGQGFAEYHGDGWLDAVHPDDRAATARCWQASVAARAVFETRYRIRRADGSYRWTAVKGVPIVDADGRVREWIGANADIDDMVAAQAELARRLDREKRYSALLYKIARATRTLHAGLSNREIAEALVGEVRDILEARHAVVSLHEDEHCSQPVTAVSVAGGHAASQADTAGDLSGALAGSARIDRVLRLARAMPGAPAGLLAVPLLDRSGRVIGAIRATDKLHGDFTEEDESILVQLASNAANGFENARLYEALREQDRRKDEFLAMLAHELRNPLAPIAAAADLLKRGADRVEHVRKASEVIGRQVRHLTSLVDDLLDVSRVTRGLIELHCAEVDVMAVIASAVEQSRPLIEARGHAFTVDADAGCATMAGDFNRLVQVVVNLLNNACKYTPRGGRIALAATRGPAAIEIAVRDNGIGLDSHLLPHVFELFTQAERTPDRSQGGLGIGLALVKNIVTMHGGSVTVHSDGPGMGSVFTVTLPLRAAAAG